MGSVGSITVRMAGRLQRYEVDIAPDESSVADGQSGRDGGVDWDSSMAGDCNWY